MSMNLFDKTKEIMGSDDGFSLAQIIVVLFVVILIAVAVMLFSNGAVKTAAKIVSIAAAVGIGIIILAAIIISRKW